MDYYDKLKDEKIIKIVKLDNERKNNEMKIEKISKKLLESNEEKNKNEIEVAKIKKIINDYMVAPKRINELKKASICYSIIIYVLLTFCITLGLKTSFLLGLVISLPAGIVNVGIMKFWYKIMTKPYVETRKLNINNLEENLNELENLLSNDKNRIDKLEINLNFLKGKEESIIKEIIALEKDLRILENYDVLAQKETIKKEDKVKKLEIK